MHPAAVPLVTRAMPDQGEGWWGSAAGALNEEFPQRWWSPGERMPINTVGPGARLKTADWWESSGVKGG